MVDSPRPPRSDRPGRAGRRRSGSPSTWTPRGSGPAARRGSTLALHPRRRRSAAAEIAAGRGSTPRRADVYEAQIAGLAGHLGRASGRSSGRPPAELVRRRGAVVAAVRPHAELDFVNGGGTGSLALTAADPAADRARRRLRPVRSDPVRRLPRVAAAARRRTSSPPVVRRPSAGLATVLGGGWVASGPPGPVRLPTPGLPRAAPARSEGAGRCRPRWRGPGPRCGSVTGSGSGTPRPASSASGSTCSIWSGETLVGPCRRTAARGNDHRKKTLAHCGDEWAERAVDSCVSPPRGTTTRSPS